MIAGGGKKEGEEGGQSEHDYASVLKKSENEDLVWAKVSRRERENDFDR